MRLPVAPPPLLCSDHCTVWSNSSSVSHRENSVALLAVAEDGWGRTSQAMEDLGSPFSLGLGLIWITSTPGAPAQALVIPLGDLRRLYELESPGWGAQLPRGETSWTPCRFLTRPRLLREPAVTPCGKPRPIPQRGKQGRMLLWLQGHQDGWLYALTRHRCRGARPAA